MECPGLNCEIDHHQKGIMNTSTPKEGPQSSIQYLSEEGQETGISTKIFFLEHYQRPPV